MPNVLKITVEDPDEILNAGAYGAGAVIRLQTGATEAGAFADVTGTGSTPTLSVITGTRIYTGYDPNGTVSSWYRTRYENAGGTRTSDWTAAFQVGDETAGLLCSLYDVQQELGGGSTDDESILEKIRQVSVAIEGYCGRWFAPRPLSGTTTILLSPGYDAVCSLPDGRTVRFARGVRSLTAFGYATTDQPTSGGTYTTISTSNVVLVPGSDGWPSTKVMLLRSIGSLLYWGLNTITWTGSFGFASVPADIQGVAVRASVRRVLGKGGGALTAVGPNGTEILLPDLSGADRRTLDFYRHIPV